MIIYFLVTGFRRLLCFGYWFCVFGRCSSRMRIVFDIWILFFDFFDSGRFFIMFIREVGYIEKISVVRRFWILRIFQYFRFNRIFRDVLGFRVIAGRFGLEVTLQGYFCGRGKRGRGQRCLFLQTKYLMWKCLFWTRSIFFLYTFSQVWYRIVVSGGFFTGLCVVWGFDIVGRKGSVTAWDVLGIGE